MKVRVMRLGYYGLSRVREGEILVLKDESEFSRNWMEKLEPPRSKPADLPVLSNLGRGKKKQEKPPPADSVSEPI